MEFATFYVGSGLSPYLRACVSSWAHFGHSMEVYTYDPEIALPAGVVRRDANEIMPSHLMYTYRKGDEAGSVSAFANEFRYRLVQAREVVWVDTDLLCLRAEWPIRDYYVGWQDDDRERVNCAIFGAPRDSPLVSALVDEVANTDRRALNFGDTGPTLMTRLVRDLGLESVAAPTSDFYPVHFDECRMFLDPTLKGEIDERLRDSLAVHLWDEIWTRRRIPTFLRPPRGSFLSDVLARHDVIIHVEAEFDDLDALVAPAAEPMVRWEDFEALSQWSRSLESELLTLQATAREEPPAESRRWVRRDRRN